MDDSPDFPEDTIVLSSLYSHSNRWLEESWRLTNLSLSGSEPRLEVIQITKEALQIAGLVEFRLMLAHFPVENVPHLNV